MSLGTNAATFIPTLEWYADIMANCRVQILVDAREAVEAERDDQLVQLDDALWNNGFNDE